MLADALGDPGARALADAAAAAARAEPALSSGRLVAWLLRDAKYPPPARPPALPPFGGPTPCRTGRE